MLHKINTWFQNIPVEHRIAGLIFGLHFFLILNSLFPSLRDLNLWDEAVYLNTGKLLAEGQLPIFSRNPLVAGLLALTYLPFAHSPFWLMQSAALGRILLFVLMWLSTFLVATQLRKQFSPLIILALLLIMPLVTNIFINQSDALFAAMSGFALWQLLSYLNDKKTAHLGWGSFFVGLAALSRNDGLVLMAIFVALAVWLTWQNKNKWLQLAYATLPFVALAGGYVLIYGLATGSYTLGTVERSYTAFQQGYIFDYKRDPECTLSRMKCAVLEAQSIYGTSAENDASVLRAISRNPSAYVNHLNNVVALIPKMMIQAYGGGITLIFFLFVLRGVVELFAQKRFKLLIILALWPLYLFVYFLTFFRIGYLQTAFVVTFVLAAFGIVALLRRLAHPRELWVWSAALAAILAYGVVGENGSFTLVSGVMLSALWLMRWLPDLIKIPKQQLLAQALLLLAAGLLLRGPGPNYPTLHKLGSIAEEQASLAMQEELPLGSRVATGSPGSAWAARMEYYSLADEELLTITDAEGLYNFFVEHGVVAVYIDPELASTGRAVVNLVRQGVGLYYEEVFSQDDGSVQVLLVR